VIKPPQGRQAGKGAAPPIGAESKREETGDSRVFAHLGTRRGREGESLRGDGLSRREADGRIRESAAVPRADRRGWDRRGFILRRLLVASDVTALGTAYAVAVAVNAAAGPGRPGFDAGDFLLFLALVPLWVLLANTLGLYHIYQRRIDRSFADELGPSFLVMTLWSWFWLVGRAAIETGPTPVLPSLLLWAAAIVTVPAFRTLLHWRARGSSWYRQAVAVIGSRSDVDRVKRRIERHPEYGLDVVAALNVGPGGITKELEVAAGETSLGAATVRDNGEGEISAARVAAEVRAAGARRAVVTGWPKDLSGRAELIQELIDSRVQTDLVSGEPEALWSEAELHHVEGLPMLTVSPPGMRRGKSLVKRTSDLSVAGTLLVLLSPLLAYIAIRIKLDSGGPILFRQERVGRDRERFQLLKFRTMVSDAETRKHELSERNLHGAQPEAMFKVPDDPRITRFGVWLRRWSLDELPQLWNVVRGDMSVVGPRPLIPEEAALVKGRYTERMWVRPGITGPWQILGRSDIPFQEMVKLDHLYVATWTTRQDMTLLLRTVGAVIRGRGAY
jgi:exopolysaccharide biosynthesis polyprenyl glycosylphosphotransferase